MTTETVMLDVLRDWLAAHPMPDQWDDALSCPDPLVLTPEARAAIPALLDRLSTLEAEKKAAVEELAEERVISAGKSDQINTLHRVAYEKAVAVVRLEKTETALRNLVLMGRTSGGTAGRDDALCEALDRAEAVLATLPAGRTLTESTNVPEASHD